MRITRVIRANDFGQKGESIGLVWDAPPHFPARRDCARPALSGPVDSSAFDDSMV